MTLPSHTPVLICGAGPTGLAAALALAQRGIHPVVIDRSPARSTESKAIGVQAGTLELLEAVAGRELIEELISTGYRATGFQMHVENREPIAVDISKSIPSEHAFLLLLPQSETERILEAALEKKGIQVFRNHTLESWSQEKSGVRVRVHAPEGTLRTVEAEFLVGADGAHSPTRHGMGAEFSGGRYGGTFVLADVRVSWRWGDQGVRVFLSAQGAAACFRLPGKDLYRVILLPAAGSEIPDSSRELSFDEFREIAARYFPQGVEFSDPIWITRFRIHHRLAETFRLGRVFLAGDAAHIHSPVGAQGMNTGIHDAIHLATNIARVRAGAPMESLRDYERARQPIARRIVFLTDVAFRAVLSREGPWKRFFRRKLLPALFARPFFSRSALRAISEVDVARREIENWKRH